MEVNGQRIKCFLHEHTLKKIFKVTNDKFLTPIHNAKKIGQQGTPLENDWPHYHERLFFQKMPFPNDGIDGIRRIDNFSSDFFYDLLLF